MNKAVMDEFGIDYKKGVGRCMDDEELYAQILAMFLDDTSFARAKTAYESGSLETLFKCVHELKGASGNAALTGLYEKASAMVEYLRHGGSEAEKVDGLFGELSAAYDRAREGVSKALAD